MNRIDTAFEVRDRNRLANIVPHLIGAALIATPLWLALTHPPFAAFVEARPRGSLQGFVVMMSVVNAAMAIDLIGLFLNLFSRQPALGLTSRGAEGLFGWLPRKFDWEDVELVAVGVDHIQLVRRTANPLIGLFQGLRGKGDKRRAADQIYLRLSTADHEAGEILFEIRRRCPGMEIVSSPFLKSPHKARRAGAQF